MFVHVCVRLYMHTLESSRTHTNTGGSEACTFAFLFLGFCEQLGHDSKLLYFKSKKIKKKKKEKYRHNTERQTERKGKYEPHLNT